MTNSLSNENNFICRKPLNVFSFFRNFIKNGVTSKWKRGIVTIGGDGVLFEVMNGIMERPDWKQIINTIPLAIIPGGSGNGLAKSLSVCTK